eukprot:GEMP01056572.1.p1 GENE.GEMP01056572.1~~GEMP01056572.1.p1  ORF type:complete len:198 (+),score=34.70 GEMP01056572.1:63-656(+)
MIICLGPVCLPIWPLLFIALKPIWNLLPEAQRTALTALWNDTIFPKCINPWFSRLPTQVQNFLTLGMKKSKRAEGKNDASDTTPLLNETQVPGEVSHVTSMAQWNALRKTDELLFVDFTASWCGPCQKIKPKFVALAQSYPKHRFVFVDIDELEDVALENKVASIPAFHVFKGTKNLDAMTIATEAKLEALVHKYAQ